MALQISSNAREELEILKEMKRTIEDMNNMLCNFDISKFSAAFLTMETVGEILHCSERAAREKLQLEGAPMCMTGRKPLITADSLYKHISEYGLGMKEE